MLSARRLIPLAIALSLLVAACSDDSTEAGSSTSADPSAEATGEVVEIPPAQVDETADFVEGARVELGETADADGLLVTVDSITAGSAEPDPATGAERSIEVQASLENSTDVELAGPDVYTVCAADGRVATALDDSEIEYLVPLGPGETTAGSYAVGVPGDCADVLLQARVLASDGGPDRIAEWVVPSDALG